MHLLLITTLFLFSSSRSAFAVEQGRVLPAFELVGGYVAEGIAQWRTLGFGFVDSYSRLGVNSYAVGGHYSRNWMMDTTESVTTTPLFGPRRTTTQRKRETLHLISFLPLEFTFSPIIWKTKLGTGQVTAFYSLNRWATPAGVPGPDDFQASKIDEFGIKVLLPYVGIRLAGFSMKVPSYTTKDDEDNLSYRDMSSYSHNGLENSGGYIAAEFAFGGLFGDSHDTRFGFIPWISDAWSNWLARRRAVREDKEKKALARPSKLRIMQVKVPHLRGTDAMHLWGGDQTSIRLTLSASRNGGEASEIRLGPETLAQEAVLGLPASLSAENLFPGEEREISIPIRTGNVKNATTGRFRIRVTDQKGAEIYSPPIFYEVLPTPDNSSVDFLVNVFGEGPLRDEGQILNLLGSYVRFKAELKCDRKTIRAYSLTGRKEKKRSALDLRISQETEFSVGTAGCPDGNFEVLGVVESNSTARLTVHVLRLLPE